VAPSYPGNVASDRDRAIRAAVFDWLSRQREELGEALPRELLTGFTLDGIRIPLVGPQGIFKPAACELPISITTIEGNYSDEWDAARGQLRYSYRGTDPNHPDNVGLRRALRERVPLVYFLRVLPGRYAAMHPVFIVGDEPSALTFTVQVEDATVTRDVLAGVTYDDAAGEVRRAYITRVVRQRVHQAAFRERVVRAYQERCALCSLRHQQLLDAAHITPDREADSDPIVSNGVALCKLHHAAFDSFFFAIRPDYRVEVRPSILRERDGPMLVVGLQQIHESRILLPSRAIDRPDRDRLARRYEEFLASA
jgi:putative restriction endonuclease